MTTLAPAEYKTQADLAKMYRRTLNELPVPAGPWAKTYAERNAKYNRQLAASIVFAIITTIAVRCKTIYFQSWDGFTKTVSLTKTRHYTQFVVTLKKRLKISRCITEGTISTNATLSGCAVRIAVCLMFTNYVR